MAIQESSTDKALRKWSIGMRIAGVPLVIIGWQIVHNTTRVRYYVLAGALLLIGTLLVSFSIGINKALNE